MSTEERCFFVSSRGLLKSCDIRSYDPKSSTTKDYQYLFDMFTTKRMHDNMSIYVCNTMMFYFIRFILPRIKHKFVLVSGDSDTTMPFDVLNKDILGILLNNKYLIKWYSQNLTINNHSKFIQLPIGLDYHTIFSKPGHIWSKSGEKSAPIYQEQILREIKTKSIPFHERNKKIYANFNIANDRFGDRITSLKEISRDLLDVNMNFIKRSDNWRVMSQYAFILSPSGNGIDCHRTWEALCLGCIPIVRTSKFFNLFEDLPVIIVGSWKKITREFLDEKLEEFKNKTFKYEKLTLKYWVEKIKNIEQ
jgi:hypothetical protein